MNNIKLTRYKRPSVSILSLMVICLCYIGSGQNKQEWDLICEMDNNLYSSYILATAGSESMDESKAKNYNNYQQKSVLQNLTNADLVLNLAKLFISGDIETTDNKSFKNSETLLGDKNGLIGLRITNPQENCAIKIEIAESPINYVSVFDGELQGLGKFFTIFPEIAYKYDELRNIRQSTPVSIRYKLTINGNYVGEKSKVVNVRPLEECPYFYVDQTNQSHKLYWMFAAYVNEDNPLINEILGKALQTGIVDSFSGYQVNRSGVLAQVRAIWYAFQKDRMKYSSITNTSLSSEKVYAQRVRLTNDTYGYSQANCVDGSVLFASVLKAIDIDPVLILEPGHVYLGYYTDAGHNTIELLETTAIGGVDLNQVPLYGSGVSQTIRRNLTNAKMELEQISSFQIGRTLTEKRQQIEKQNKYIASLEEVARKEISNSSFFSASEMAKERYTSNIAKYGNDSRYQLIDISKIRSMIKPIWR